mmetsp:Transcript_63327/g.57054  ORF Transcript_63327/g.57054 Transcript_63327/m.57054 type:complete len:219 (-) Transcript_63327:180-836(-)
MAKASVEQYIEVPEVESTLADNVTAAPVQSKRQQYVRDDIWNRVAELGDTQGQRRKATWAVRIAVCNCCFMFGCLILMIFMIPDAISYTSCFEAKCEIISVEEPDDWHCVYKDTAHYNEEAPAYHVYEYTFKPISEAGSGINERCSSFSEMDDSCNAMYPIYNEGEEVDCFLWPDDDCKGIILTQYRNRFIICCVSGALGLMFFISMVWISYRWKELI